MISKRVEHKFIDYRNAFNRLKEAIDINIENDIIVDGVIQRFEFTYELAWKVMKSYLEYEGIQDLISPRATIKAAYKFGIIEDGDAWIAMMMDRNRTSHIYDEKMALKIYKNIKSDYIKLLESILIKIDKLVS